MKGWRCEACKAHFRSISAFDHHREGEYSGTSRRKHTRHCLSADEMRAKGMAQASNGNWFVLSAQNAGEAA